MPATKYLQMPAEELVKPHGFRAGGRLPLNPTPALASTVPSSDLTRRPLNEGTGARQRPVQHLSTTNLSEIQTRRIRMQSDAYLGTT